VWKSWEGATMVVVNESMMGTNLTLRSDSCEECETVSQFTTTEGRTK